MLGVINNRQVYLNSLYTIYYNLTEARMRNQDEIDKKYLYKQNKQLRVELREAKQLIRVHKDAIARLSQLYMHVPSAPKVEPQDCSETERTQKTKSSTERPTVTQSINLHNNCAIPIASNNDSHPKSQTKIVSILLDLISSTQQISKIEKLNEKILSLEGHQMVLEKIVEQTDNDEKETYHMLAEEYNKIKQDNEKLEAQLHKFYEKIGEVDYLSGLVTKYKEVALPTEQAVAFKKEQDQLLQFISMQRAAIRKLTDEKDKLLKINVHMKESVEKHKDQVRNMTMILNSPDAFMNISMGMEPQSPHADKAKGLEGSINILDQLDQDEGEQQFGRGNGDKNTNNNDNNNVAQMGGKVKQSYSLNPNMSLMSPTNANTSLLNNSQFRHNNLNTTMNFIRMQRKIIKEEEESALHNNESDSEQQYECEQLNILFPDKVEKIKKDKQITKVPYLNMMKIRQLMAKRDTKIRKQIEAENRHINPTDKIIKLETELEITRKELTSQTLKFRIMADELKQALKLNEEYVYRNELLMAANERLQTNYRNVYKDYQLTKIVALRVERAMGEKLDNSMDIIEQINTTKDFEDKLSSTEALLRRVLGKKVTANRSQSLHNLGVSR